jgi:ATPase complex subunit ATP10
MEYLRNPLGIANKHIGYVYLVDENLRLRWAGGGDAMAEEAEGLERCAKVLLDRLDQVGKPSS